MSKTYRYYGTVESRGRNYRQLPNPKPKANLGEGHPAKNLEQQLADAGVKTGQNIPWYKDARGRQLYAQKAVKNKTFDDFKPFSDEQIRQMYPDDAQLANYIINGKNGTFMRDVKSLNEDAIAYEKKYGKVSDADVDSIIDAAIQKRDKKSLEDMGILTNDAIERWVDRHPSNSGFGKTGNILKSWRDEPAKYIIEPEVTDVNNSSKSAKTEDKSIFDIVQDGVKAENSKPAETNTANQLVANPEKVTPENQAAKDMVDTSKSKNVTGDAHLSWFNQPWRDIVNNTRDKNTPSPIPPNRLTGDAYPIVRPNERSSAPYRDFNWRENTDNLPFYNKNAVNRHIPDATYAPKFYLSPVKPLAAPYEYGPIVVRKAAEKAYDQKLNREIAIENAIKDGLWGLGILGATAGTFYGLDKLGKYIRQDNSDEQSQTQVPYKMEPEPEPVNEAVVQPEPTLEQQYADQSTPAFNTRINNLFDLYQEQEQLARDKAAFEAQLRAQAIWQRVASRNGYTPELREVTPVSSQEESSAKPKVSRNTDSGSAILNASNQRKPKAIPKNKADNKPAKTTSQTASKPEAALAKALLKAQTESRTSRGDSGLQQYRYQSLLNSGLRGMTPDEAIRSGLLTPEQVQVLMRGPY